MKLQIELIIASIFSCFCFFVLLLLLMLFKQTGESSSQDNKGLLSGIDVVPIWKKKAPKIFQAFSFLHRET